MITSVVGEMAPRTRACLPQITAEVKNSVKRTIAVEFPEERFLPQPANASEYQERVRRGYYRMRQRRVIMCVA